MELTQQIEEIINKSTKDLKSKIDRVVSKHQNKIIKEHSRELKNFNKQRTVKESTNKKQNNYRDSESTYSE